MIIVLTMMHLIMIEWANHSIWHYNDNNNNDNNNEDGDDTEHVLVTVCTIASSGPLHKF